jgi:signal transduction histidine kinase
LGKSFFELDFLDRENKAIAARNFKKRLKGLEIPPYGIKILDHTSNKHAIRADAGKMERVFINLIKNAVDAMLEGGTLEIRSSQTKGNVKIAFEDTGAGVSETVMA